MSHLKLPWLSLCLYLVVVLCTSSEIIFLKFCLWLSVAFLIFASFLYFSSRLLITFISCLHGCIFFYLCLCKLIVPLFWHISHFDRCFVFVFFPFTLSYFQSYKSWVTLTPLYSRLFSVSCCCRSLLLHSSSLVLFWLVLVFVMQHRSFRLCRCQNLFFFRQRPIFSTVLLIAELILLEMWKWDRLDGNKRHWDSLK